MGDMVGAITEQERKEEMIFDRQTHKDLALQALEHVNVPGKLIELVYEYKQAILAATVLDTLCVAEQISTGSAARKTLVQDAVDTTAKPPEIGTELTQEQTSSTPAAETAPAATGMADAAPKRSWPARKPRGVA